MDVKTRRTLGVLFALLVVPLLVVAYWSAKRAADEIPPPPSSIVAGEGASGRNEEPLRLTFAGDLMAHSVNYGMTDFDEIYRSVRSILKSDDLSFINLEFPIDAARPYSSYPRFNVQPEYVQAAIDAGFEVFSVANNHTADWHAGGIEATLGFIESAASNTELVFSGVRDEPDVDFEVETIVRNNRRIGFIAITQFSNEWRNAGLDRVYLVSYRATPTSDAFLSWLAGVTDDYDLFLLSYHGGVEYALDPDPHKLAFFRRLVDAGVDIVWGHHPHVLQPWELIRRPDGSQALVIPSAGNFVSGQTWRLQSHEWSTDQAATGDSALYEVAVDFGNGGPFLSLRVTPITNRRDAGGVVVDFLPTLEPTHEWSIFSGQRHRLSRPQLAAAGPRWFVD